ncbi:MAG: hypothetical protein Q9183_004550 [Haloplaca sp. 2 TL-2023]
MKPTLTLNPRKAYETIAQRLSNIYEAGNRDDVLAALTCIENRHYTTAVRGIHKNIGIGGLMDIVQLGDNERWELERKLADLIWMMGTFLAFMDHYARIPSKVRPAPVVTTPPPQMEFPSQAPFVRLPLAAAPVARLPPGLAPAAPPAPIDTITASSLLFSSWPPVVRFSPGLAGAAALRLAAAKPLPASPRQCPFQLLWHEPIWGGEGGWGEK